MKKYRIFIFLGIFFIVYLIFSNIILGLESKPLLINPTESISFLEKYLPQEKENLGKVILQISNLFEVRKDLIGDEMSNYTDGWYQYYVDYNNKISNHLEEELFHHSKPFNMIWVYPNILESLWVEIVMVQNRDLQSDEWAEKEYKQHISEYNDKLNYDVHLWLYDSSSTPDLSALEKENLKFVYRDSNGNRIDGIIKDYMLDKPTVSFSQDYRGASMRVEISINAYFKNITWYSFHVISTLYNYRGDLYWEFTKD